MGKKREILGAAFIRETSISPGGPLCNLDGDRPVGVVWVLAAGCLEVQLLQAAHDGAHLTRTDLAVVYLCHGRDLETGAGEEDLVGGVEFGTAHVSLVGRHPELLFGQLHHRVTGYALQDIGRSGGVIRPPLRSRKMLAALASETKPSPVKKIASSYPARCAASTAKAVFTYEPVHFARAGMALSAVRRHDETQHLRPVSST